MKKVLKYIGYILCFILPIFIVINITESLLLKNDFPFKYKSAVILSGSMEPTLSVDDLVIVKKVDTVKVGDIVSFYDENDDEIMHRIIEIDGNKVITKGDNNNTPDNAITKDRISGVYVGKIKYLGKFIKFIKTPLGITICFVLIIILLLIPTREIKEDKKEQTNEKKYDKKKIAKIVALTIGYLLILAICIIAGYYSKYQKQYGGIRSVQVATLAMDKAQVLQVNTESLYPGSEIKYRFGIKNNKNRLSEVTMGYSINIITTNNLPITYSLKCISQNNGTCITVDNKEPNTPISGGVMPYIDTTHIYELTIKWKDDDNDYSYSNDIELIKIKINAEQID